MNEWTKGFYYGAFLVGWLALVAYLTGCSAPHTMLSPDRCDTAEACNLGKQPG